MVVQVVMDIDMQLPKLFYTTNNKKNSLKNDRVCRNINYIKTEKGQEQDRDGTLATKVNITSS